MKLSFFAVLGRYLKRMRFPLLYFFILLVIYFAVYGLYDYPLGAALYAGLLGAVAGLIFMTVDFYRYWALHRNLSLLPGRFPLDNLPDAKDLIAQDYTAILSAHEAERRRLTAKLDSSARDAQEYYTLWAHQIKTPLAAMSMVLQQPEMQTPTGSIMRQELFRTEQYVGMVLQYQRLSSLNADLVLTEHRFAALAKQAIKNMAPVFIYKKVSIVLAEIKGSIITDEKWFVFVLEQLLSNAVKYTPSGGRVTIEQQSDDTLSICDTGAGIQPEDLPRVFDRGYTGIIGRQDRRATGIGLYLCREILTRLGFSISIDSVPGKGTNVRLDLSQQRYEID